MNFTNYLKRANAQDFPPVTKALMLKAFEAGQQATRRKEWRSLETAPKDGTKVLLRHFDNWLITGEWKGTAWHDSDGNPIVDPSHWMPQPWAEQDGFSGLRHDVVFFDEAPNP